MQFGYVVEFGSEKRKVAREILEKHATSCGFAKIDRYCFNSESFKKPWTRRILFTFLKGLPENSHVFALSPQDFSKSNSQILEILNYLEEKNITVHFVHCENSFKLEQKVKTDDLLKFLKEIIF